MKKKYVWLGLRNIIQSEHVLDKGKDLNMKAINYTLHQNINNNKSTISTNVYSLTK